MIARVGESSAEAPKVDSRSPAAKLEPFALKDAPALIEAVFPAQKVSFEAQRERKANLGQTLTGLGSYWKGRKPLILVRAIVLGSLLPQTADPGKDLEIFEKLMAFDEGGLARRALENNAFKPDDIARALTLDNPWQYFTYKILAMGLSAGAVSHWRFPLDPAKEGIRVRWRTECTEAQKLELYRQMLRRLPDYDSRAGLCKRPEELDEDVLYASIWPAVNAHLGHLGIDAQSHQQLVEQLGILRFGHRPRVGDTFCGGGSIPFEAARLGCDVYASDLNPIACMLTWGALNIIGASPEKRAKIERAQHMVAKRVERIITRLGVEYDSQGNRAKSYLYCLEARCPETGWLIPMAPSWVISKTRGVIANLVPDNINKRFSIRILSGVSASEMKKAERGTLHDGNLVYQIEGHNYRTPIKTIRGDFQDAEGNSASNVRRWEKHEFMPRAEDVFQERLYCIHWITRDTLLAHVQDTFFAAPDADDMERERKVQEIVLKSISSWQRKGLVPEAPIEVGGPPRYQGRSLVLNYGWTHWHHLFNPRNLVLLAGLSRLVHKNSNHPELRLPLARALDWNSKLCHWHSGWEKPEQVFYNQALDGLSTFGTRSSGLSLSQFVLNNRRGADLSDRMVAVFNGLADEPRQADVFVTDPPYADAVMYHEITDFFIAWLRKNPPPPFDQWTWDSRRELAIKGSGDDFRRGMVAAYKAMTEHMPDNGMQCVMFTHQDTGVWSDMVSIFWASGLQVVGAWYIATETTSELKKGGFVQGTVVLALRKRPAGERPGFKQRILPEVKREVDAQVNQMLHLNTETAARMGAPVFNDADLQMAGYAAALKVLTGYTSIGGEDVTAFALRPRRKGESTVVDEIVEQAAETANGLLVPDGLARETWTAIGGIQRFYLRMLDMETTGAAKLDNYQNFAKAFRVRDYAAVMASIKPNAARLKSVREFETRDLTDRTELGPTPLGALFVAIRDFLAEKDPEVVMANLRDAVLDYLRQRPILMDMADFLAAKARAPEVRRAAEAIVGRMRNQRFS